MEESVCGKVAAGFGGGPDAGETVIGGGEGGGMGVRNEARDYGSAALRRLAELVHDVWVGGR